MAKKGQKTEPSFGEKKKENAWPLAVTNILMPDFRHAHNLQQYPITRKIHPSRVIFSSC